MGRTGDGVEIRGDTMRISFYYEGKRCRPMIKIGDEPMKPTKANLLYAKRLVEEVKAKIKSGEFVMAEYFPEEGEAGPTTLRKVLDTHLATFADSSTKDGYTAAANFWKNASYHETDLDLKLGDVPARQLKLSFILTALARRPDLSGKTINNYVSVLRSALELAVKDNVVRKNLAEEVPSSKWQRDPPDPFTPEERDSILAYLQTKHPGQAANMVRFWMWSGLRTGELLGLRWTNVDLASGTVLVKEARVNRKRKGIKTGVTRTVRLNSESKAALLAQKAHTFLGGAEVFQDPRHGEVWDTEANFRKVFWTPALKALGIRYRRPYQCRHTYATVMLHAKMNPAMCAKQLGHDVKVFLDIYAKWIEGEADDREMALLESAIRPSAVPSTKVGEPK